MRTLLARGPFGLDSISNETFSPPWRPSKSPSVPLRWKKYSCPSSALINPKPRSGTSFLMLPVNIWYLHIPSRDAERTRASVREGTDDHERVPLTLGSRLIVARRVTDLFLGASVGD